MARRSPKATANKVVTACDDDDPLAAVLARVTTVDDQTPEQRQATLTKDTDRLVVVLRTDLRTAPLVLQALMALERAAGLYGQIGAMPKEQGVGLWEPGSCSEVDTVSPSNVPPEPPDDEDVDAVLAHVDVEGLPGL